MRWLIGPAEPRVHVHYFIWVCTDDNGLICRCACGMPAHA